jgi:hypothetical protein
LTVRTRDPMSAAAPEPTDRDVVKSFISGTESESGAGGVTGRFGMIMPRPPLCVMVSLVFCYVEGKDAEDKVER